MAEKAARLRLVPRRRRLAVLTLSFLIAIPAYAQRSQAPRSQSARVSTKKKASSKAADGQVATITTDGALILKAPDPDAAVIQQLKEGTKVRVSSRPVSTQGEEKFRKVRVGNRIGYVAEIDIRVGDGPAPGKKLPSKKDGDRKEAERKAKALKRMSEKQEPMFFTRYVGVLIGNSEFKEGIHGVDASTNILIYGLKITGPDVVFGGPVVDFNLALHYGAPDYYERLSATKPSGFVLLTDALFLAPIMDRRNSMFTFGLGPLLVLSKYALVNNNRNMDLTEVNLGLSLAIAGAMRFDKVAVRVEGKYFIEKRQYKAIQASIQTQF